MGSLVLTTLSIFLGLFFIFVGSMKVTPGINKDMHREIRKNFIQYSKVFPLTKSFGFKVPSKWYRLVVGWIEVACGTTLLLIPGFAKQVANILLLMVMLAAFYSHVMLSEKFERMAPSIVFSLMLCCRLVVFWQIKRKERKTLEKLAAQKTTSYAAKPDEAIAGPSKETKVD